MKRVAAPLLALCLGLVVTVGCNGRPGDGASTDSYPWLSDSAAFRHITVGSCELLEADTAKLRWHGHRWTDCGRGCQESPLVPGPAKALAAASGSGAREINGQLQAFLSLAIDITPRALVAETFDVSKDRLTSMVASFYPQSPCETGWLGSSPALAVFRSDARADAHVGLVSLDARGPFRWSSASVRGTWNGFAFGGGYAGLFEGSSIRLAPDLTSPLAPVHAGRADLSGVMAADGLILWINWSSVPNRIWGWTVATGAVPWIAPRADATSLAITDKKIVWIGAHGQTTESGSYGAAELYWAPRTSSPTGITIHQGPSLPIKHAPGALSASGDWVAVSGHPGDGRCELLVANLARDRLWTIPSRAGRCARVLGISQVELLASEEPSGAGNYFDRLLRYDLNQLTESSP